MASAKRALHERPSRDIPRARARESGSDRRENDANDLKKLGLKFLDGPSPSPRAAAEVVKRGIAQGEAKSALNSGVPLPSAQQKIDPQRVKCPYDGCNTTAGDVDAISRIRTHLHKEHPGWEPAPQWLSEHDSKICEKCKHVRAIKGGYCRVCKVSDPSKFETGGPAEATRAESLPAVKRNEWEQMQLGGSQEVWNEGLPPKKDTPDVKLDTRNIDQVEDLSDIVVKSARDEEDKHGRAKQRRRSLQKTPRRRRPRPSLEARARECGRGKGDSPSTIPQMWTESAPKKPRPRVSPHPSQQRWSRSQTPSRPRGRPLSAPKTPRDRVASQAREGTSTCAS